MSLATIMVRLGLDASGFSTGLKRAESMSKQFSVGVKSHFASLFSLGMLTYAAKNIIDYGGKINDLSQRLRISAETLQEWDYAAKQAGSSLDAFVLAYTYLSKSNLGKTPEEIMAMFNGIARAVREGGIQNEIGEVNKLLGRGGGELIPVFRSGLSEMADEARTLGAVIKDDVIKQLDDFGDKIERLKTGARGPAASAIVGVGGFLLDTANKAALQFGKMVAGVTAYETLIRNTNLSAKEADKLAQQIAFEQTFGASAKSEIAGNLSRFVGKPGVTSLLRDKSEQDMAIDTTRRWSLAGMNQFEAVGAFSGSRGVLYEEAQKQTRLLSKIADSSEDTAEAWAQ